jgi:small-conductance mechanosensitive channel
MYQFGPDAVRRVLVGVSARLWLAAAVFLAGTVVAVVVGRLTAGTLRRFGVPEATEGTALDRTTRRFDTTTVGIVGRIVAYTGVVVAGFAALSVAGTATATRFWAGVAELLPSVFVALLILLVGVVVGDKVELVVAERLKGVKLPQTGALPTAAKYSVFYVAVLVALSQVGVQTLSLVVLLAAYVVAVVVVCVVAFQTLLSSGAVGVYLLLNQPYAIGDEVRIAGHRGIVQEVDLFVTHVENDGEEYILPNAVVFTEGVVRVR